MAKGENSVGKQENSEYDHALSSGPVIYAQVPYRFINLLVFGVATFSAGAMYNTIVSIASTLHQKQNLSYSFINSFTLIYYAGFCITNFPINYLLEGKGMRFSLLLGMLILVIGQWLRVFFVQLPWLALIGQILGALSNPFFISSSAKLSSIWFRPSAVSQFQIYQRAMATTVATLANIAGNAVGALLPGLIVSDKAHFKRSQVTVLFLCHACFASVAFLAVIFFFRNKPPVPPSPSAQIKRQNVIQSIKILAKDCNFIIITLIFFCMNSGFTAIMEEVLSDYGYSNSTSYASFIGFILLIFGLIGSLLFAMFAGKFKKFKLSLIIVSLMTTALIAFFTFYLVDLRNKWYTGVLLCAYGFFNITGMPLAYELSAEVTFPIGRLSLLIIGESISSGILVLASQLSSIAYTVVTSELLDKPHTGTQLAYVVNIINFGISALGTFFCFFIKEELKRSNMDKMDYNKLQESEKTKSEN